MEPVLTVGLDGSPESLAAAHWAADEAERRSLPLRLLHAWPLLAAEPPGPPAAEGDQNYWSRRIVDHARAELQARHPDLSLVDDLVADDAEEALLRASTESEMLVLGSRGLGAARSYFLGDISMRVVAHAQRPVVLVRAGEGEDAPAPGPGGGVVVGMKLHGPCDELLDFAFRAAAAREAPLRAVHGESLPVNAYVPWGVDPDVAGSVEGEAHRELDRMLRPWRGKYPGVQVEGVIRLYSPAKAVVRAAEDADLLVVGRRRHRPPLGPHLGPAVHASLHHGRCPVAVVPHE
jgi:nucleotide-binding universal stress UspA family protein